MGLPFTLNIKKTDEAQKAATVLFNGSLLGLLAKILLLFFDRRWQKRWKVKLKRILLMFQKGQLKVWRCPFQLRQNDPVTNLGAGPTESQMNPTIMNLQDPCTHPHLRSEIDSFDGVLPNTKLGELCFTFKLSTLLG